LAFVVGIGLACGIRQDEFLCENAVSHLQNCCQGFTGRNIACKYDDQGCQETIYTEFNVDQSKCILAESCATLVSSGVCSRAAALPRSPPGSSCTCGTASNCNCPGQSSVTVCP
jgi:hypothetical protein